MKTVSVFVSHAFSDQAYDGGVEAFRSQVRTLVESACRELSVAEARVTANLVFQAVQFGRPLMEEIRRQISDCDFVIADISEADDRTVNPNVMYEIGFATALNKPKIVMRRSTDCDPPADIRDILAGSYDQLADIPATFALATLELVTDSLNNADQQPNHIYTSLERVWFPRDVRSVALICAPDPMPSPFSHEDEPNYVHIDNFDDRDAVIELATFFARRYPRAKVERMLCSELPQDTLDGNMVILGGPGCEESEGNEVCKALMRKLKSVVSYPPEADGLFWEEKKRQTEFDDKGRVTRDWGTILAAPNPYNHTARVILLHGTNTYGTLGAATALIDSSTAMRNHLRLESLDIADRLTKRLNFEVLVETEVGPARRPLPPTLDLSTIRRIEI